MHYSLRTIDLEHWRRKSIEEGKGEAEAVDKGRGDQSVLMKTLCILDTSLGTSHIFLILQSLCKVVVIIST